MDKKAIAVPGRERINNLFFGNLERKRQCEILPSSLNQPPQVERSGGADVSKNSYSLPASASFPRVMSAGSRVREAFHWVSSWSPVTVKEEK